MSWIIEFSCIFAMKVAVYKRDEVLDFMYNRSTNHPGFSTFELFGVCAKLFRVIVE